MRYGCSGKGLSRELFELAGASIIIDELDTFGPLS